MSPSLCRLAICASLLTSVFWSRLSAAQDAIITVRVLPPEATLLVDGVRTDPNRPLHLPPGQHRLQAELTGYAPVWRDVVLVAGDANEPVTLRLAAKGGLLSVISPLAGARVLVDGEDVGPVPVRVWVRGGRREITVVADGGIERRILLSVTPGETHSVMQQDDGQLFTDSPDVRAQMAELAPRAPERTGLYVLGYGALLAPLVSSIRFEPDGGVQGGAAAALRAGYRAFEWVGFEGQLQYTDATVNGTLDGSPNHKYHHQSFRFGAGARVFVPGRSVARLSATLTAGAVYDVLGWSPSVAGTPFADAQGVDGYVQLDVGVQLEFFNFLTDLAWSTSLQSTGGMTPEGAGSSAFDDRVQVYMGPVFTFGYGAWAD